MCKNFIPDSMKKRSSGGRGEGGFVRHIFDPAGSDFDFDPLNIWEPKPKPAPSIDAEKEQAKIESKAAQDAIAQRTTRRRRRRASVLASGAEGEDAGLSPAAIALDTLGG